jgi:hypothetical protein
MYCKYYASIFFFLAAIVQSCGEDNGPSCVTCSSSQTASFEVCEESTGNASVNGQDTGTPYTTYISGLEQVGANCNN